MNSRRQVSGDNHLTSSPSLERLAAVVRVVEQSRLWCRFVSRRLNNLTLIGMLGVKLESSKEEQFRLRDSYQRCRCWLFMKKYCGRFLVAYRHSGEALTSRLAPDDIGGGSSGAI